MKLNFWQILGGVLIVAGILYGIFSRSNEPAPTPPPAVPTVSTQPA